VDIWVVVFRVIAYEPPQVKTRVHKTSLCVQDAFSPLQSREYESHPLSGVHHGVTGGTSLYHLLCGLHRARWSWRHYGARALAARGGGLGGLGAVNLTAEAPEAPQGVGAPPG